MEVELKCSWTEEGAQGKAVSGFAPITLLSAPFSELAGPDPEVLEQSPFFGNCLVICPRYLGF